MELGPNPFISSIISSDGSTKINAQILPDEDEYMYSEYGALFAIVKDDLFIFGAYNRMNLYSDENVIQINPILIKSRF